MKTRLDQLTLHDLIELCCGDTSALLEGEESPSDKVLLPCARQIMIEYKEIASPNQAKINMIEGEEITKLHMKEKCARICIMLCLQGHFDMAKEVLLELAVSKEHLTTNEEIMSRCRAKLDEAMYEIKRAEELRKEKGEDKPKQPSEIRKSWFSEIAYVMSVFKMNIDPKTTNAAIYANLVRQAGERAKAMAKMPPMMGMFL